jgi:hypothetical protein
MARMRVALALPLAAALATGAASATRPATLTTLRDCGTNRIPASYAECPRDRRGRALVASELDCSARSVVRRTTRLAADFRYQGQLQYAYKQSVRPGRRKHFIGVYMHNTAMPAGSYSCSFTLGSARVLATFRSGGPTGRILGPSVCLGAHTVGQDECARDEGGAPLPATSSITCDAVFARERGRTATVQLIARVGGVALGTKSVTLDAPIVEAGGTFKAPVNYVPGNYACRFAVAGEQAERPFTIAG